MLLLGLLPSVGQAVLVHTHSGHRLGVALHRGLTPASIPGTPAAAVPQAGSRRALSTTSVSTASSTDNGALDYQGGPVLHTSAPYLVFWDPSGQIGTGTRMLLSRYFSDVSAANPAGNVYGVDRQYTDGSGYAGAGQVFSSSGQVIADSAPYPAWTDKTTCPAGAGVSMCLTDGQVQAEVSRLISAEHLPSGYGADAPIYFVVLPPSVDECYWDGSAECSSNVFCAYHSAYGSGSSTVLYGVIPMLPAAQQPKACQADGTSAVQEPNGNVGDVVLKYLSHEDNETITDPLGTGWYDSASGNENGDECDYYAPSSDPASGGNPNAFGPLLGGAAGTLYDQLINGDRFYLQTEWSNGGLTCDAQPAGGGVSAGFTAGTGGPGVPIALAPSVAASWGFSSATWSFGDGSPPQFNRGAPQPVQHTYAAAGEYRVTLTVISSSGQLVSVTRTVSVGTATSSATGHAASTAHISAVHVRGRWLTVKTTGPGTLHVQGRRIVISAATKVRLRLRLSMTVRHELNRRHRLRLTLRLLFRRRTGTTQRYVFRALLRG